jgi:cell division control protein 6
LSQRSVFIDEGVLDINYVPSKLLHRESELRFLNSVFSSIIDAPYEMSQRAVIVGGVGSGKTALSQRFGKDLEAEAARRRVKAKYIHVNCREVRGSLFMAINRVVRRLRPNFPDRGFSADELLDTLMRILDEEDTHLDTLMRILDEEDTQLVLSLDEVDALIEKEGGDALYNLSRVQEARLEGPRRLSLICISKDPEAFQGLDRSTLSTLQRNIIKLPEYTAPQLSDILISRTEMAYRPGAISEEILEFIGELAASENGDARYGMKSTRSTCARRPPPSSASSARRI